MFRTGSPPRRGAPRGRSPRPAPDWPRRRNIRPDPPHCRAMVSLLAGTETRVTALASASTSSTKATEASTVLRVPPHDLDVHVAGCGPTDACSSLKPRIWLTSQPRPSTTTWENSHAARSPPGCGAAGAAVPSRSCRNRILCVSATTPSTFGKFASGSSLLNGLRRNTPRPVPPRARNNSRWSDADVVEASSRVRRRGGCSGRSPDHRTNAVGLASTP